MKPLRIIITAGPTIEPIDPVRFISNRSTGYMGYELARSAKKRKHKVILISGPTFLTPPRGVRFLTVQKAGELREMVHKKLKAADVLIMASAVADFRPRFFSRKKVKSGQGVTLRLAKNPDILKSISRKYRKNKIMVGFSLETGNLLENALKKLRDKKLDLIIANKAGGGNDPFGRGPKTVYLLKKSGEVKRLKRVTKSRIARTILDTIEELCYTPN